MAKSHSILPGTSFNTVDDNGALYVINEVRRGIDYVRFMNTIKTVPLTLSEWSGILHVSERTMQRYRKDNRTFDSLQSEKIIQVTLLFRYGKEVFGSEAGFYRWLGTESITLGRLKPKELLDSAFGIDLLKDELTRIEHGVLS